ncbi:ACT domain-containing protein [Spirosoma endophyticum]|uniref:ACT domain-containing protein n=1 Tax=Spirosoma endophyticum TaxID=662367 RepID=A0A1I2AQN9_9BACT|nr:ACT domain-containing protein [Spirosoma endophyticum]SFE45210.1 ACT domain-containing protein [Spirosoma endophyticum]
MNTSNTAAHADFNELIAYVTYQIAGFDRVNFVSDIANTIPQDGNYTIRALSFEADGLQANGLLTVQMREDQRLTSRLVQRLQSVRGIVSVREIQ